MHGRQEISRAPRIMLNFGHAIGLLAAAWIFFAMPEGTRIAWLTLLHAPCSRRILLFSAAAIYFLRILVTTLVLLRRRMEWGEALGILVQLVFVHVWFALLGRRSLAGLGPLDFLAIILYLLGSYLNTVSEYGRLQWKRLPQNAGHLYTGGLFRWSRHINYFGDTVLFTGYALMTAHAIALVVPALMAFFFAVVNVPQLDRYLAAKYSSEYQAWAARTPRFIPFVY